MNKMYQKPQTEEIGINCEEGILLLGSPTAPSPVMRRVTDEFEVVEGTI